MSDRNEQLDTPVALFLFRRPETTLQVLETIARAQPKTLLVVADGPRSWNTDDGEKCLAVRQIIDQIDWDCNILTNYADENMGLRRRISSGISWTFQHVDRAIILEDDCVPEHSFFHFCDQLLDRYRDDARIIAIAGDNFQHGRRRTDYSYYFSRYNHCWGWATWRRAWQHYDDQMTRWPEIRDGGWLMDILNDPVAVKYWSQIFQATSEGHIDSWAYRWTFGCWLQSGLTILPEMNLVQNIGFGADATNTKSRATVADTVTSALAFPLRHPPYVIRDTRADEFTQRTHFDPAGYAPKWSKYARKGKRKVRSLLK